MFKITRKKLKGAKELDDESLLNFYQQSGELYLLNELFGRYMHLVFGVCMKYLKNEEDSKDEVMNIFESLIDKLPNQEIDTFKGWLYVVTKNHCLMVLRKKKKEDSTLNSEVDMENHLLLHPNMEETDFLKEVDLEKALNLLNGEQRKCIELFYLENKSYKEIASLYTMELNKVKSYIQNGKRNLKKIIEEGGK